MNRLFIIQLIASFIVGGTFIALLSFLAERSSERIAGMIISLPSTAAISLFFIGWSTSPQAVADVIPVAPLTAALSIVFSLTYLYLARLHLSKLRSVVVCVVGSLVVWFLFSIPLAVVQFSNLRIALAVYAIVFVIGYYFITVRSHQPSLHQVLHYTAQQKLTRAMFAGLIITSAVFLSKIINPFWGVIFSYFPAAYLSTFIILHWHYDSSFLFKVWKNSPLGSLVFVIYPLVVMYTFPAFGIVLGTITAYAASLTVFVILQLRPRCRIRHHHPHRA